MTEESREMDTFPVLLGDEVAHFHSVSGGYNDTNEHYVVNLIHEIQGPGSPYRVNSDSIAHTAEAHLSENFYNLDVDGVRTEDEYPDEPYVLSLKVSDYQQGPYSFNEALSADVDSRETRFEKSESS
jgi:hypothetical protein